MINIAAIRLYLVLYGATLLAAQQDRPWPQKGYDSARSGLSLNTGPQGPQVVPEQSMLTQGSVISSPLVADHWGTCFVGSSDGSLYMLTASVQAACYVTEGPILSSPAIGDNDWLYFGSDDGFVYAVTSSDCSLAWKYPTAGPVRASPLLGLNGMVFIQTNGSSLGGLLIAFNGTTGCVIWNYSYVPPTETYDTIAMGNDLLVLIDGASSIITFDPMTGTVLKQVSPNGFGTPLALAVSDSVAFIGFNTSADKPVAFAVWDFTVGALLGSSNTMSAQRIALGVSGKEIFAAKGDTLYALKAQDVAFTVLWSFKTGGTILSTPAVDALNFVYFGSNDGNVYAVNGTSGVLTWQLAAYGSVQSSPAIGVDNLLYIGSNSNYLFQISYV
jgi:outer membrane protein assembly factor BamB